MAFGMHREIHTWSSAIVVLCSAGNPSRRRSRGRWRRALAMRLTALLHAVTTGTCRRSSTSGQTPQRHSTWSPQHLLKFAQEVHWRHFVQMPQGSSQQASSLVSRGSVAAGAALTALYDTRECTLLRAHCWPADVLRTVKNGTSVGSGLGSSPALGCSSRNTSFASVGEIRCAPAC